MDPHQIIFPVIELAPPPTRVPVAQLWSAISTLLNLRWLNEDIQCYRRGDIHNLQGAHNLVQDCRNHRRRHLNRISKVQKELFYNDDEL